MNRAVLISGFLLLLVLLLSLGQWQLRRAAEKTRVFDRISATENLPALAAPIDDRQFEGNRYRRLQLRGRYDGSQQLLLDNMIHEGQAGYHVLTLFRPEGAARWLVVNRGWVRAAPDRRMLPDITVNEAVREIRGRIDTLPRPGLTLETAVAEEEASWPQVVFFPTIDELEALSGKPLFRYQLWLDEAYPDGYVRAWTPRTMTPEQHIGYAIQWFGLAAVLVVMAVAIGVSSAKRHRD
jgi:surfeit locus 1 family protein